MRFSAVIDVTIDAETEIDATELAMQILESTKSAWCGVGERKITRAVDADLVAIEYEGE